MFKRGGILVSKQTIFKYILNKGHDFRFERNSNETLSNLELTALQNNVVNDVRTNREINLDSYKYFVRKRQIRLILIV